MKKYILFIVFLLSFRSYSQHNDTQAFVYNIGIGSVFGGVGALINKKPNEKNSKVFIKGLYQGALGGAIVYGSKKMVYNFHKNENLNMLWSSKLVHATGVSIIENAASNRDFWEKWHINIGFNRLEINTKKNFKVRYKLLPVALVGTIIYTTKGKFSFKHSLQTLTPVFISNNRIDATLSERFVNGEGIANSIIVKKEEYNTIIAHELIHAFQYNESNSLNTFFNKPKTYYQNKYKFIDNLSDWIYIDILSYSVFSSLYLIENKNRDCYYDNFFESEANFYSKKKSCP